MIDFYHMASTTEQWECPNCHNCEHMDDWERAHVAINQPVELECRRCNTKHDGLMVRRIEGTDYSFDSCW